MVVTDPKLVKTWAKGSVFAQWSRWCIGRIGSLIAGYGLSRLKGFVGWYITVVGNFISYKQALGVGAGQRDW